MNWSVSAALRRLTWLAPTHADSGTAHPPKRHEHVTRIAPARNKNLCRGTFHRPWPVGAGWICLRCSHYEHGGRP